MIPYATILSSKTNKQSPAVVESTTARYYSPQIRILTAMYVLLLTSLFLEEGEVLMHNCNIRRGICHTFSREPFGQLRANFNLVKPTLNQRFILQKQSIVASWIGLSICSI